MGKSRRESPPPPGDTDLLRVAVGAEKSKWATAPTERLVVAVTRNETTNSTLLSVASTIFRDTRIQIAFTIAPDRSASSQGLEPRLAAKGVLVIPWRQLESTHVDLLLAASHAGQPFSLSAPTIFLPHRYGRTRDKARSDPPRPGDITPGQRVIHTVPHASALDDFPAYGDRIVTGDPIYDSLCVSQAHTHQTRDVLGLTQGQKLIVVTSTWRRNSLFARRPTLFDELLATLPHDEYVIAAILHSNIWIGHGRWQTQTWLKNALERGLRLIPYDDGWRPTIAAADVVIGDHGSVTFYADLLGKPVFRISTDISELTRGTRYLQQVLSSPQLTASDDLHTVISTSQPPPADDVVALVSDCVSHVGNALTNIRNLAYTLMSLDPPTEPSPAYRPPLPDIHWSEPTTHWATLTLEPQMTSNTPHATLQRFSAPLTSPIDSNTWSASRIMVALHEDAHPADTERASVLILRPANSQDSAEDTSQRLRTTLAHHPAAICTAVAHGDGVYVATRDNRVHTVGYLVRGISATDTRAATAAALLTLFPQTAGGTPQPNCTPSESPSSAEIHCGDVTWQLTKLDNRPI